MTLPLQPAACACWRNYRPATTGNDKRCHIRLACDRRDAQPPHHNQGVSTCLAQRCAKQGAAGAQRVVDAGVAAVNTCVHSRKLTMR
jgi:hypothetical protein